MTKSPAKNGNFRAFAIVPAAGQSNRMGTAKLPLIWRHKPLLEHTLEKWKASPITACVVVISPGEVVLRELAERCQAIVVEPDVSPRDMKASVLLALEYLEKNFQPEPYDAWLVAPADMPNLPPLVISRLIEVHREYPEIMLVPTLAGRRGHPILFPWLFQEQVRELQEHEGLKSLLAKLPYREIDCQDIQQAADMFTDIDTPEDFSRLQRSESAE